jgi:4-hydroxybenzoate polyprenyltransferase
LIGAFQKDGISIATVFALGLFQVSLLFPVLLSKDYKDIKGDKKTNIHTPLVIHGKKIVQKVALFVSALSSIIYVWLTIKINLNLLLNLFLVILYLYLSFYLHYKQGRVNIRLRQFLTLVLLTLSLSLISII